MFGMIDLEEISGSNFWEVLRNLVLQYVPDGEKIIKILIDYMGLFLLLGLVLGIFQCFLGYAARRVWTAILLLALCGYGGAQAAETFLLPTEGIAAITTISGIIGGLIGYFLWGIGCFLRPLFVVFVSGFAVFAVREVQSLGLIVGLSAGLISGIVVAVFYRVGLMLYTALFGGLLAGACIVEAFCVPGLYASFIIGGIFAATGFGIQFFTNWKLEEEADKTDSAREAAKRLKVATQADTVAQFAAADEEENSQSIGTVDVKDLAVSGTEKTEGDSFAQSQEERKTAAQQAGGNDAPAGSCPSCGALYSARAKFCMQCGHKL